MNPIRDAPLLSAPAEATPAAVTHESHVSWPGLRIAASGIGVPLEEYALQQLAQYRDLLLARNASVNLTALASADEIDRKLIFDALAMLPVVDRLLSSRRLSPMGQVRLVDVGSGAGFPGLVLKIARPGLRVTLIDATAKKVSFLREAVNALRLDGVEAVHGRAEELAHVPRFREAFDIGTARAVAALPVLLEYVVPFLDVGGEALLPKGLDIDAELTSGRRAARLLGATIVSAELLPNRATRLVIARKTTLTGKTYPRRTGVPARAPLGTGD